MLDSAAGSTLGTTSQKVMPLIAREDLKSDFMRILELKGQKYPNKDEVVACSPPPKEIMKIIETPTSIQKNPHSLLSTRAGTLIRR
jgi:hypothetical protein